MTVRVRIPARVSTVWDLLERRPAVTWTSVGMAAAGIAAIWRPSTFLVFLATYFAFMAGLVTAHSRLAEMRSERDSWRADAIAKDQELTDLHRALRHGLAIAATRPMHSIGERGERT